MNHKYYLKEIILDNMAIPTINPSAQASFEKGAAAAKERYEKGIVNFGDPKLNTNTTTAKGLEKVIAVIYKFIIKAQGSVLGIIYGKFQKQNSNNPITKAIDRGVTNILKDVAEVDLCNLLSYAINEIPGGSMSPFCEPAIVTSTPHASCSNATLPSDEIVSTMSRAG